MDLCCVRAKGFCPCRGEVLRHNVFNGIYVVVQVSINVLRLDGAEVFQALKQIGLVFAAHQIYLLRGQRSGKLLVVREAPAFSLGEQGIDKLLDIALRGIVVPQNFPIQIQEDLVQGVGRDIADIPAEQVVFCDQEYLEHIIYRQLSILIQAKHFHQEGTGDNDLKAHHAVQAVIQLFISQPAFAYEELFKEARIPTQILQQGLDGQFGVFRIFFERAINIADGWGDLLLDAQVISDKTADIITGAAFDGCPVCIVQSGLIQRGLTHQDIVADLIAFGQSKASGVQALENELCIISMVQRNADDLQFSDGGI